RSLLSPREVTHATLDLGRQPRLRTGHVVAGQPPAGHARPWPAPGTGRRVVRAASRGHARPQAHARRAAGTEPRGDRRRETEATRGAVEGGRCEPRRAFA